MKKNIQERMRTFLSKYGYGIPAVLYFIVYLMWFCWLEKKVTRHFTVIHMAIDDYIPFCEVFVIPYLLWFLYVAAVVIYFFFKDRQNFSKACIFLGTGMTVFLVISTLWPNGHYLRPFIMPRDNIFTQLISFLYRADTPTNLWPSIHVYNSIGAHLAISRSSVFENQKGIRMASLILAVSIILSTVFIKQHSVFDMLTAFGAALPMYILVYRQDLVASFRQRNQSGNKSRPQIG